MNDGGFNFSKNLIEFTTIRPFSLFEFYFLQISIIHILNFIIQLLLYLFWLSIRLYILYFQNGKQGDPIQTITSEITLRSQFWIIFYSPKGSKSAYIEYRNQTFIFNDTPH